MPDFESLDRDGLSCRGEGCPRADLCCRHMGGTESSTYFETAPVHVDGTCTEFVSNGRARSNPDGSIRCGGAHPPPRCACQCEIEMDVVEVE